MSKYLSDQNQLVFQYESGAYANTFGTPQWIGLVQEHTPDEKTNPIEIRYQGSSNRNVDLFEDGKLDFTGTFSYYPQDWKFLGMAIGATNETATAGSHVLTETNSDDANYAIPSQSLSSFTLEDSKNSGTVGKNFIRTYKGCMIDTLSINWAQGEPVNCEVGYMAQSDTFSSGAITLATPTTTRPYMFSSALLQIPSGVTVDNATEFKFDIKNNLEAGHYNNGSKVIAEPLPLKREYELTATMKMDSTNAQTFYEDYFLGGSTFNAMIQSIGDAGSVFITMSGCKVSDMKTPSPVEGSIDQTLTIIPQTVSANVFDAIVDYNAW